MSRQVLGVWGSERELRHIRRVDSGTAQFTLGPQDSPPGQPYSRNDRKNQLSWSKLSLRLVSSEGDFSRRESSLSMKLLMPSAWLAGWLVAVRELRQPHPLCPSPSSATMRRG
jgi:hypothetical protein